MSAIERAKMIGAMEFIARAINDESVFEMWLINGVEDGLINKGDMTPSMENDDYYLQDEAFAELMGVFLELMTEAKESGGLYCDNVVSTEG